LNLRGLPAVRLLTVPFAFLVVAALATGCAKSTSGTTEPGYLVKVTVKGAPAASLTIAQLQDLPKVSLDAYGKSEEGPTLLSALDLAGVKDFSKITISGLMKGRVASAELTLTRDQVTGTVILDFTNRGTVKLAGADIPEDNWIIDVTELKVE